MPMKRLNSINIMIILYSNTMYLIKGCCKFQNRKTILTKFFGPFRDLIGFLTLRCILFNEMTNSFSGVAARFRLLESCIELIEKSPPPTDNFDLPQIIPWSSSIGGLVSVYREIDFLYD